MEDRLLFIEGEYQVVFILFLHDVDAFFPFDECILVTQIEPWCQTSAHFIKGEASEVAAVILGQVLIKSSLVCILHDLCSGDGLLHVMGVQVEQTTATAPHVFNSHEVEGHMIFAACYSNILWDFKEMLDLDQICWLYEIEP